MTKKLDHISKAKKDLELARKYRKKGDIAVATLLYNNAISRVLRSLYFKKTGSQAPADASVEYMSSRASLPDEVEEYVKSVMETETMEEEIESIEVAENYTEAKGESKLLYLDGLIKRLLDYASAY